MTRTLNFDLKPLLEALWRRRYLFCLPILLMIPASVLFSIFGPKIFIAKSLILLQEAGRDNPLAKDLTSPSVRMQERVAGLEALAKSDRVLSGVLKDVMGDQALTTQGVAQWKQEFAANVGFELIGTDFIELRLKGSHPKGMGRQLESLTTRFIEALLAEQGSMSAIQMLIDRRKQELDAAEKAYANYKTQVLDKLSAARPARVAQLDAIREQAREMTESLTKTRGDIENTHKALIESGGMPDHAETESERLVNETRPYEGRTDGVPSAIVAARARLAALLQLRETEAFRATLQGEFNKLNLQIEEQQRDTERIVAAEQTAKALEKDVGEARDLHHAVAKRFMGSAGRSLGVLSAPERIKLIDLPSDPAIPISSAMKYVLAGIVASLGLALGLVYLAELMDQTVRSEQEFERIAGAPVLARLP